MRTIRMSVLAAAVTLATAAWAGAQDRIVIRGATLVDVRDGRLVQNALIEIQGDRIVSVTQGGSAPAGATVLDATGKYVVPGLIDLHVHYKDWSAELYLNHGVTTVVSLGDTYQWIREQKRGIADGTIPGPRMFHSTENIDRTPADMRTYFVRPHNRLVKDAAEARTAMREYAADKVDAVKVYDGLEVDQLREIVAEATKANIPVIGHFKDVFVAGEVGGHGIEHMDAVAAAIVDPKAREEAVKNVRRGFAIPAESVVDQKRIPEIAKYMVEKNLYLNPTFRMAWQGDRSLREKGFHVEDFELTMNDWRLRYVPLSWRLANLKEYQEINLWHWADLTKYEQDLFHQGYLNSQKITKAFVDAGGKVYAGTDSANMAVPGLSLHQEMELLVAAGLTPLAALQAATVNSAELLRKTDTLGTVETGKVGDLVILDGNPLENIRNTRKIWRVISRGRVLDGSYDPYFVNPVQKTDPEQSSHFFPSPRIRTATPLTLTEGASAVTITVDGTGFIPYSFVRWNGRKLKTEFVTDQQLRAQVPAELVKYGTYEVTVENPDFAWGTIFARGASDIAHLGIRDHVSNEFKVTVRRAAARPSTQP